MIARFLAGLLPPAAPGLEGRNSRLLGGALMAGIGLGILFDTVTYTIRLEQGFASLIPKVLVYSLCTVFLFLNRAGYFRLATYGSLMALSLYGTAMYYVGSPNEPALAAMLAVLVAGILLTPLEGLGIILFNLALWVLHGRYGDALQRYFPMPEHDFMHETIELLVYGIIGLTVQAVITHFLRQTLDQLETARKQAEAASSAKSLFLSHISHELRTPASGIIGLLNLALKQELSPTARREVEQARNQAESQLAIVNDLLDLAKIEAGRFSMARMAFDPRELFGDPLSALRQQATDKGLLLSVHIDPQIPLRLMGDPLRLRQIVINLVGNAVKFTQAGSINIEVVCLAGEAAMPSRLRIRVIDTGIGISAESQKKLFQSFEQGDRNLPHRAAGTGLGLAISRSLALAMGGDITAQSLPGRGSVFTFEAPFDAVLEQADPGDSVIASSHSPHVLRHRLRILLVEDVPINRHIAQALLHELGQSVDWAENGHEACLKLSDNRYDMVLMDLRMPVMDGLEATRTIRSGGLAERPVLDSQVRIVALTANVGEADQSECFAAGMSGFLAKPLKEGALTAELVKTVAVQESRGFSLPLLLDPHAADTQPSESWVAVAEKTAEPAPTIAARLFAIWRQEAPKHLKALQAAKDQGDYAKLSHEAHRIKGAAAYLALADLQVKADRLEMACEAQTEIENLILDVEMALEASLQKNEVMATQA